LILIGAVVIGGLAAFLILSYVRGVENRSDEANQLVEVVVAAGPIPKGTSADQAIEAEQVVLDKRRRQDLPANSVRRFADIQGQIAALDLSGGEVVTTSMFISPTETNGSRSASLDKGNVAVTISVDEAAGVAGLVQPGDNVNILARFCVGGESCDTVRGQEDLAASAGGNGVLLNKPASYVFQNVKVLAVGQSLGQPVAAAAPSGDPAAPTTTAPIAQSPLITVQLPPAEASLLASLRDSELYLTLNRPDYEPVPVPFTPVLPALPGELGVSPYPQDSDGQ
jgi:Flp pilus assembly protein CpaB